MNRVEIKALPILSYSQEESINSLATSISYCGSHIKSILITSRTAKEGKSFISLNLLRTFAALGKKVVLVDTDLRRSVMASRYKFTVPKGIGVTQYLAGVCELEDAVCETNIENAYIIPCGRTVENSLQLLASPRMKEMMELLTQEFDLVLVDTSPGGTITDALEIAKHCDGGLIVVGYNIGHTSEIIELADAIQRTGCNVLGVTLNQVKLNAIAHRGYYYGGYRKYNSYRYEKVEAKPEKKTKKSKK